MKKILLTLLVAGLTGCGAADRILANFTGDGSPTCFKGVTYIQFTSGASVAYNIDGTLVKCD